MSFEPNFDLLKELCESPGVSGREEEIRKVVVRHLHPLCDEIQIDTMGNVIGIKKGKGNKRVLIAGHMDEIGFIVNHIDDKGFLRLQPIGGWSARNMVSQRVYVHGYAGQKLLGALQSTKKMTPATVGDMSMTLDDFFVDVGMSAEAVKKLVEVGDPVTMARTTERVGDNVVSKTLDDRVGVFMVLETLRRLQELGEHECDILAVATVQEEVGLRGATTVAYHLEPDIGIALDITLAGDHPDSTPRDYMTELGKGVALKIKDGYSISTPTLVRHFRDVAEAHKIPYQLELLPFAGSDSAAFLLSRGGMPAITLSLPTRYAHTPNETAAWEDIKGSIELLARYLMEAHTLAY
jgi:tetrahedral aminopeptidase